MITTSTGALSAPAVASLAVTSSAVNTGTASLPVFGLTPDGTVAGAFLTATPSFVGRWVLTRRTSGMQGVNQQIVAQGDQGFVQATGAGPFANLTALDILTLTLTAVSSGSVTLSVVQ